MDSKSGPVRGGLIANSMISYEKYELWLGTSGLFGTLILGDQIVILLPGYMGIGNSPRLKRVMDKD